MFVCGTYKVIASVMGTGMGMPSIIYARELDRGLRREEIDRVGTAGSSNGDVHVHWS